MQTVKSFFSFCILASNVHRVLEATMKEAIKGKTATLVEDGWSNIHNKPVVASCLQVGKDVYFLESCDTGAMTKSEENCKILSQKYIQTAKEEYECDVKSLLPTMPSQWKR